MDKELKKAIAVIFQYIEETQAGDWNELKEMLETLTYDKLVETAAARAESIQKQLKFVPMPNGKAIFMG